MNKTNKNKLKDTKRNVATRREGKVGQGGQIYGNGSYILGGEYARVQMSKYIVHL